MDGEDDDQQLKARLNRAKKERKKRAKAKKKDDGGDADDTKRTLTEDVALQVKVPGVLAVAEETEDNLEFEDPFEDVYEEEDIADNGGDDDDEDGGDSKMEIDKSDEDDENEGPVHYYAPNNAVEGEELEVDPSAYGVLHQMQLEWPALSFDFFVDHTGHDRTKYPMSIWMVSGSQADVAASNELTIMRISNITRTRVEDDDEAMVVLDDDEEEGDPILEHRSMQHRDGVVNRVRAMPQQAGVVACWGDNGCISLFDARKTLQTLSLETVDTAGGIPPVQRTTPVFVMNKHKAEGYGLDWSPCRAGRLASGDQAKEIYIWDVGASGTVTIEPLPFKGHTGSVEDLQWSPTEETVLASCSTDGTVRIWDTRVKNKSMLTQQAHEQDVNVISWNRKVAYLLASGSDDSSFKVWDLRQFSASTQAEPVGWFKGFHKDAISSIEWSPHDESVIACASADNLTTVWDLALEEDREYARQAVDKGFSEDVLDEQGRPISFPPQLLFVHAGVKDPKEVHFHPQAVGLLGVTGDSGFDLFLCEPLDPKSQHKAE